jgi:hypothetical protein
MGCVGKNEKKHCQKGQKFLDRSPFWLLLSAGESFTSPISILPTSSTDPHDHQIKVPKEFVGVQTSRPFRGRTSQHTLKRNKSTLQFIFFNFIGSHCLFSHKCALWKIKKMALRKTWRMVP